jgi:hypothetical protein
MAHLYLPHRRYGGPDLPQRRSKLLDREVDDVARPSLSESAEAPKERLAGEGGAEGATDIDAGADAALRPPPGSSATAAGVPGGLRLRYRVPYSGPV